MSNSLDALDTLESLVMEKVDGEAEAAISSNLYMRVMQGQSYPFQCPELSLFWEPLHPSDSPDSMNFRGTPQ